MTEATKAMIEPGDVTVEPSPQIYFVLSVELNAPIRKGNYRQTKERFLIAAPEVVHEDEATVVVLFMDGSVKTYLRENVHSWTTRRVDIPTVISWKPVGDVSKGHECVFKPYRELAGLWVGSYSTEGGECVGFLDDAGEFHKHEID